MRRFLAPFALVAVLALSACGGGDSDAGTDDDTSTSSDTGTPASPSDVSPCDLTTEDTVAQVFGGTVESAEPGEARNCEYTLSGASVTLVEVYYFGDADDWDALKAGYEANRGPLTPVDLGDEAFYPGDLAQNEYVVLAGDTVFAVGIGDFTTDIAPGVAELAGIITGEVG
ncbi:hypothetical protein [Aeromicrobium alkaliterrae]